MLRRSRRSTGIGATRYARGRRDTWKHGVGMASQIWFGGGGPPSYAWTRVTSDGRVHRRHRDAGHRHRHAHRDGADRRRGARPPARPRRGRPRRHGARPVRDALRRLVDDPVCRPCRARGGRRCEAADHRDRGAALRPRGAGARHQGRHRRLRRRESLDAAREAVEHARATRRSSARARAARTRRG